jgi:hypothetical protein
MATQCNNTSKYHKYAYKNKRVLRPKQSKAKQNKAKHSKTQQNETKQSKTKASSLRTCTRNLSAALRTSRSWSWASWRRAASWSRRRDSALRVSVSSCTEASTALCSSACSRCTRSYISLVDRLSRADFSASTTATMVTATTT